MEYARYYHLVIFRCLSQTPPYYNNEGLFATFPEVMHPPCNGAVDGIYLCDLEKRENGETMVVKG